jgi:hypothetical protein
MGIMHGNGRILFKAAKFKVNFFPLSDGEIATLYKTLVGHLSNLPHGPFHALAMLLGTTQAKIMARSHNECILPDCFVNEKPPAPSGSSRQSTSRKRGKQADSGEGDFEEFDLGSSSDMDEDVPATIKRPRRG